MWDYIDLWPIFDVLRNIVSAQYSLLSAATSWYIRHQDHTYHVEEYDLSGNVIGYYSQYSRISACQHAKLARGDGIRYSVFHDGAPINL